MACLVEFIDRKQEEFFLNIGTVSMVFLTIKLYIVVLKKLTSEKKIACVKLCNTSEENHYLY